MTDVTVTATRRERVRASTVEEIKRTARRLIVEEGLQAMTLRAIAREMGMTAPGLYRYFPSHEDLVVALVVDVYDELAAHLARDRDAVPAEDVVGRLTSVCRGFRTWAVTHPRDFALVFGTPLPSLGELAEPGHETSPTHLAGMRFAAVFTDVFFGLWLHQPFPVPAESELPPGLVSQLRNYRGVLLEAVGDAAESVPIGAIHVFLRCWVQLYGLVAMEVYSHLHFCLTDVEPFYEANLHDMAQTLGIKKVPQPS